jgi:two-component system sensor histidine kinase VicK
MKELHGYLPEEEPNFEALLAQIPKKYRQKVIRIIRETQNRQGTFYLEYPVVGFHDQQQRWLRVLGGSDQPSTGNTQFLGVIMDITGLKQNELRRNRFIGMVTVYSQPGLGSTFWFTLPFDDSVPVSPMDHNPALKV